MTNINLILHIVSSNPQITAVPPPPDEYPLRKYTLPANLHSNVRGHSAVAAKQRSKSHMYGRPAGGPASAGRSLGDSQGSRTNPAEDDLLLRVGARGRARGEFTNPQGVACTSNGEYEFENLETLPHLNLNDLIFVRSNVNYVFRQLRKNCRRLYSISILNLIDTVVILRTSQFQAGY